MLIRRVQVVSGVLLLCSTLTYAQALFRKPVKVVGDPNFIGTAANPLAVQSIGPNWVSGQELNAPSGIALDTSVSPPILYVADTGNHRVLGYHYAAQNTVGAVADLVIGQVDLFSNQPQNPTTGRQSGFNSPTGVAVDKKGNLFVADTGNNRVLEFPQPFSATSSPQLPTLVIGQKTLGTNTANLGGISASSLSLSGFGRTGLAFDPAGNLWVVDTGNNRVLRFPAAVLAAGTAFPAADMVIGQIDFVSASVPQASSGTRVDKTVLLRPNGISFDSSGRLYLTDQAFRVLVYNTPIISNQVASRVLGVDTTTPTATTPTQIALNSPFGVIGLDGGPLVADTGNNRLMQYGPQSGWEQESKQFSPSASSFVGQASFTENKANRGSGDASASSVASPVDFAAAGSELYLADAANNRILVYVLTPFGVSGVATRVIGQLDFPYKGANLVDGKGFSFVNGFPAGVLVDSTVTPSRFYVADTRNNRVLGYKNFITLQNGQTPDIVIGQPDLFRNSPNYPSGDSTLPTQSGLNLPTALALDSAGNLFIADTGNSRILRFPAPFSASGMPTADLVLGQRDFTSQITDATAFTMSSPIGIALTVDGANASVADSGWLVATDNVHNRVLFFPKPWSSGMSATTILGQSNYTSVASGSDLTHFNSPRGVAVDPQDQVIVADTANARVQIFGKAASLVTFAPALISLNPGFTAPISIAMAPAGDFWVDDNGGNDLLHYPSVANLALTNNAPDAAVPAILPHSAAVDRFNNLVVSDGINRIVYFAPQINVTNAANYSTRPLTAGTIAALFPAVTSNPIAADSATAPGNVFPLPKTLADTQILLNGKQIPLLFVSPKQDNVILPNVLPTSGTMDLQAVHVSTGQIYGAAEVSLATASPGLFTLAALGSGQVIAVNFQDGSINDANHAVARGQFIILYGTGVGPVPNPPADGAAASGQPAVDLPNVLIAAAPPATGGTAGFIQANATYSGLAPGYAGLWQINVQIPSGAQTGGTVTIKVLENSIPNLDQGSTLTTTIAVK